MEAESILRNVREVAASFAAGRRERQQRRALDPADFARLKEAGFLLTAVPIDQGGMWEDVQHSTRSVCEILRTLAHGDSSVALVCSVHPTVLAFWLTTSKAPSPFQQAWETQRRHIFSTAREGAWWGTITSEPGSGGDLARTSATARPAGADGRYLLTGQKQFGSGSGVTSYMITSGLADGEEAPAMFVLDMRGVPWDGGTFSRSSPFGHWHEDVRALGFLRPPWGLAYDTLFDASCRSAE